MDKSIDELMNEIRDSIERKGLVRPISEIPQFDKYADKMMLHPMPDTKTLEELIVQLSAAWEVPSNPPIDRRKGLVGVVVYHSKRMVRKIIHFQTDKIAERQSRQNMHVLYALVKLRDCAISQNELNKELHERLVNAEKQLEDIRGLL